MAVRGSLIDPGSWATVRNILLDAPKRLQTNLERVLLREGVRMEKVIKQGIKDQAPGGKQFVKLHPFTIRQKGGKTKALINTGSLRNSIKAIQEGSEAVFVGIERNVPAGKGTKMVDIAAVHEFGVRIPVSVEMRAHLRGKGLNLKDSTAFIVIPARPFIAPSFEAEQKTIQDNIRMAVADAVKTGKLPTRPPRAPK